MKTPWEPVLEPVTHSHSNAMAHLLRGKQAGIANDLSAGLTPDLFVLDVLARYGVNSQLSTLAYDPVQSLLAVGTRETKFGPGQVYIYGRNRIAVTLPSPARGASIRTLQFCADKLVCLDSKHDVAVYSLELKRLLASYSPPGVVTVLCTDPTLDYALLGMQSGDVIAYDLDREVLTPFKIPNLWVGLDPRARIAPVVSLQLHPRDVGTLLIGYAQGAVIYSFKLAKVLRYFNYEIPRGAPGGDGVPTQASATRRPRLTQATWHPTGTFIMTGYEDSSIVFWDVNRDGRMLVARTRTDVDIATPGTATGVMADSNASVGVKEPIFKLTWCANGQDPDDTGILIAGGASTQTLTKGLCFLELGRTPVYATSSWEVLANHFRDPKRQRILPTPPGAEVIDFCLIPRISPHYGGAHDPIAVLALLSSGELLSLSFPSGMPITPTNQLHPSLTFVTPFMKRIEVAAVDRERWLGMTETRAQGPAMLKGGSEASMPVRKSERRSIIRTSHADGTIRLWDVGHGDEIENGKLLQVDVARAAGRFDNIDITMTSLAASTGELAVGLRSGELVVFRWGRNRYAGREPPASKTNEAGQLTRVTERVEPSLTEGLVPLTLLDQQNGPVTAVKMSDVGFVATGFEGGNIAVIDLRGPAIIHNASVADCQRSEKGGSLRRRGESGSSKPEWATQIEFSVMTLDREEWSSILLHVGTNLGNVATFKVVPDPSGRYSVQYAGSLHLDNKIAHLFPIHADTGRSAHATQTALASLGTGVKTSGAIVAVTPTGIHIFRPASNKGAHKSFDGYFCDAAGMVRYEDQGYALLTLAGDGNARAYSLPALREIATVPVGGVLDIRRFDDARITPSGHIIGFTGPSELALLNIFGTGLPSSRSLDRLFNPEALIPPRPTISAIQWVTGTQYITPADLDLLIGGPDRPPSKRMIAQAKSDEASRLSAGRAAASSSTTAGQQDEGYWAYMQRQVQERTERLGLVGDSMDNLEQSSANWLEDVNKFVGKQKRAAATGCKFPIHLAEKGFVLMRSSDQVPLWPVASRSMAIVSRIDRATTYIAVRETQMKPILRATSLCLAPTWSMRGVVHGVLRIQLSVSTSAARECPTAYR